MLLNESQDGLDTNMGSSQVSMPTRPSTQHKFVRDRRQKSELGYASLQAIKQAEATYGSQEVSEIRQPLVAVPPIDIQRTNVVSRRRQKRCEQL